MEEILKIPQQFFRLFYSRNRYIYMESLMIIYDEYLYNDYFLSKETCIQLIAEHFSDRIVDITADDEEGDTDTYEPMATKILNRLVRFTWLKKVEDYSSFKTNIVIMDYASIFIEVFKKLSNPDESDTDLYIQNVYTNIFSFYHDNKVGMEILRTAMVNITRLNRSLQDMLHNMDQFFGTLLEKDNYEELLNEHLDVYVETIVNKKYSLLKTSDNFYIYKNDIKKLLRSLQEDENRIYLLKQRLEAEGKNAEEVENEFLDLLYQIERGIINMENRISHIDSEHSKYVRATVSRLEYLLSNEDSMKGNVITLLNLMGNDQKEVLLNQVANAVRINDLTITSSDSLYRKRGKRRVFEETVEVEERTEEELSKEEILRLNRNKNRYNKEQIEQFILDQMEDGIYRTIDHPVNSEEEFELLILAYDYSIRKNSPFHVVNKKESNLSNKKYTYPDIVFERNNHVSIL
ncbi:Wadjet anti-phage system protein JetA family protein [Anaerocolumna sp. MB42-C2]|uniref:Wadjet anti-phage system protein JetA family protein n=1 Tax=Anaerocolumna sp. MB42-C2 TaxID=3070997 RepID=UPI0027DFC1C0|nr:Wadjet anti-phage system protein JetA family protein [Anaerocolumna sp. MB42-C2]WMJ89704.1 DUF5716 family protein [Anaerocolumna sp. MB42-C2]